MSDEIRPAISEDGLPWCSELCPEHATCSTIMGLCRRAISEMAAENKALRETIELFTTENAILHRECAEMARRLGIGEKCELLEEQPECDE